MINKERNYYFDNAKFILIFLVVFAHLIEPLVYKKVEIKSVFLFIYTFHMPTFILISGYFANVDLNKERILKMFKKFILTYIIFQTIFVVFTKIVGITYYKFDLLYPAYTWWFLLAIFVWNVLLKLIVKLNVDLIVVISVNIIIALGLGYSKVDELLAISRIVMFSPFFMLGYYFKKNNLNVKNIIKSKVLAILILTIVFIVLFLNSNKINLGWVWCNSSYSKLNVSGLFAVVKRLLIYIVQFITTFSILNLIPSRKNILTKIGENTMPIYIVHGFVVKLILAKGFYDKISSNKLKLILIVILSSIIVCTIGIKFKVNRRNKLVQQIDY